MVGRVVICSLKLDLFTPQSVEPRSKGGGAHERFLPVRERLRLHMQTSPPELAADQQERQCRRPACQRNRCVARRAALKHAQHLAETAWARLVLHAWRQVAVTNANTAWIAKQCHAAAAAALSASLKASDNNDGGDDDLYTPYEPSLSACHLGGGTSSLALVNVEELKAHVASSMRDLVATLLLDAVELDARLGCPSASVTVCRPRHRSRCVDASITVARRHDADVEESDVGCDGDASSSDVSASSDEVGGCPEVHECGGTTLGDEGEAGACTCRVHGAECRSPRPTRTSPPTYCKEYSPLRI